MEIVRLRGGQEGKVVAAMIDGGADNHQEEPE